MLSSILHNLEKVLLVLVAGLTVLAASNELMSMTALDHLSFLPKVTLADILLMFLFAEVISMVKIFYNSRKIPVVYPMFIAITALSRLIVLQSKEMDPQQMLYEAIAIAALTVGIMILRFSGHYVKGDEE